MENDTIRASGANTLIDIWVRGKVRAICITRPAIETFLGADAPRAASETGRSEFVRTHMAKVVSAAEKRLRESDPDADTIVIDAGQLGGAGERRKADRRKGDRRKLKVSPDKLPHGERRRSERRSTQRRKSPKRTAD